MQLGNYTQFTTSKFQCWKIDTNPESKWTLKMCWFHWKLTRIMQNLAWPNNSFQEHSNPQYTNIHDRKLCVISNKYVFQKHPMTRDLNEASVMKLWNIMIKTFISYTSQIRNTLVPTFPLGTLQFALLHLFCWSRVRQALARPLRAPPGAAAVRWVENCQNSNHRISPKKRTKRHWNKNQKKKHGGILPQFQRLYDNVSSWKYCI